MLKEASPVISDFLRDNPNEMHYSLNINDDENVLAKFEQLFQGKTVVFDEDEIPSSQKITKILQIKNCPNYLKPKSLHGNDINSEGNRAHDIDIKSSIEIYKKWFINFLNREEFLSFKIVTKKKEYECCIFGIYSSELIKQMIEKDSSMNEFKYDYDDEYNEFQSICDFFNFKKVDITSNNMDSLKEIAEDLKINCIIEKIDSFINNYEKYSQKIDEQQTIIDSIDQLFDLLYKINEIGIEKVKVSIIQSKWSKDVESVQELAAFILQVIRPSFSLQKEMVELLIELNEEANETNKLNILLPFIIENLMNFYMPQYFSSSQSQIKIKDNKTISEPTNLNNKCVYSFIRILYKKGLIPKERIIENLKYYNCCNKALNAFFLPEIIEIDPKNTGLIKIMKNLSYNSHENLHFASFIKKYFPDKIDLYEKMLDNMEPDDDLTKSLLHDDVDTLQKIINISRIDIKNGNVPYNIFDDYEENLTLINYAASKGSLKCFKYLLLNNGKIDNSTLYFAVFGGNVEIIKIVDQKDPVEEKENNNNVNNKGNFDTNRCINRLNYNNFWFNDVSKYVSDDFFHLKFGKEKNNCDNLFEIKTINGHQIVCLNYSDINNIIATTIVMHRNDLFDWIFEKGFISKGINGIELKNIALLSAVSGNAHSIVEIIDRGLEISSDDFLKYTAKNGFCKLTQLLLNIIGQKTKKSNNYFYTNNNNNFNVSVSFGNLSILKLFIAQMNAADIEQAVLSSIEMNYMSIINFYFDNIANKSNSFNKYFVHNAINNSIKKENDELFKFLMYKFKTLKPKYFKFNLFTDLLNNACNYSNLSATKVFTDLILKEKAKFDFSKAFMIASSSGATSICLYFIDKKVFIDYDKFTTDTFELGFTDEKIFEIIFNKINPNYQYKLLKCIDQAIRKKNKNLIEFILKQNPPMKSSLFEAVLTHDVEIVDLILKYNRKPSFINQKKNEGTVLHLAVLNNDFDIVKLLLSIPGINPSLFNIGDECALGIAIRNQNIDIIESILDFYGDDINLHLSVVVQAFNMLKSCFNNNEVKKKMWKVVLRFLSIKTIDPNFCIQNTFLYEACSRSDLEIVESLLKIENIDVNQYCTSSYDTPLICSIQKGNNKIAEVLIKHPKTDLNLRNDEDKSALMIAVENNLSEIVDLLVNDDRFDPIESKLNFAFILSSGSIAEKISSLSFLDVNESFEVPRKNRAYDQSLDQMKEISPLVHFVKINDVDKIEMVINHPSFNKYKSYLNKAIFIAAKTNNINVFRKLIKLINNDVNIYDKRKKSLFIIAAMNSCGEIIDEILNNPQFHPKKGEILYAFAGSYSDPSQYKNNDQNQLQNQNQNQLQIQQTVLNPQLIPNKSTVIEIMNKIFNYDNEHDHCIDFSQLLKNGRSFYTIITSNYDEIGNVTNFLLDHGADPNLIDANGVKPLAKAMALYSFDMFNSLINSNKIDFSQPVNELVYVNNDVTEQKQIKTTYLHIAAKIGDSSFLNTLLNMNVIDINSTNELGKTPLIEACQRRHTKNINLLFEKDNLDYLHCDIYGKDALRSIKLLPPKDIEFAMKSKENYHDKIISLIDTLSSKKMFGF